MPFGKKLMFSVLLLLAEAGGRLRKVSAADIFFA